jgi:uncharacterized protein (DUF2147 family)
MPTNMKRSIVLISFISLISFILAASPLFGAEADGIVGLWNTPGNESKIEIFKCGDKYCGRIAELKEPNYGPHDKDGIPGQPVLDLQNPNPALRTRPLVGIQLMQSLTYSGKNLWEGGEIYNPDNGKTYRCKISLPAPNRLEMRGFIGFSLFGRTSVWKR